MLAYSQNATFESLDVVLKISSIAFDSRKITDTSDWEIGIEGNFPLHKAVVAVMPSGTKVVSSEFCGVSAWTRTAKVSVNLPDGSPKRYFLKV